MAKLAKQESMEDRRMRRLRMLKSLGSLRVRDCQEDAFHPSRLQGLFIPFICCFSSLSNRQERAAKPSLVILTTEHRLPYDHLELSLGLGPTLQATRNIRDNATPNIAETISTPLPLSLCPVTPPTKCLIGHAYQRWNSNGGQSEQIDTKRLHFSCKRAYTIGSGRQRERTCLLGLVEM